MGQYSIKDIERISGIKAHTLRMWEKRYGIIEPKRTDTNIRYYTNTELKKILNIAILNNGGVKISKIVGLSPEELHRKVLELGKEDLEENVQVESLVAAMIELDEFRFVKILTNCTIRLGFEETVSKIFFPFFRKVGLLWQAGAINSAQEHFISNLIRQKLIVAIDGQSMMPREDAKTFLLFLPEGELHELGLLFYNYLVQKQGHKSIYLGQTTPISDVQYVLRNKNVDYVLTSALATSCQDELNTILQRFLKQIPTVPIILTNRIDCFDRIEKSDRLFINQDVEEFKKLLK